MTGLYRKNLQEPDELIRFEGIVEQIVEIAGFTVSRTVQAPGWRWSTTDPRSPGALCESHHVGLVLSGRWGAQLEDGALLEWGPEDLFDCPPGHDGYTIGDEPCVMVEWVGVRTFTAPMAGFGDRLLATLLFTDLVGSTEMLARIGDIAWHDLLSEHYHVARTEAGDILVSDIARALAAPAGLAFEDRGERELKGLHGTHRLYGFADR